MAQARRKVAGRFHLLIWAAVWVVAVCAYLVYEAGTYRYAMQMLSADAEQWEGWMIKYSLDELGKEYPEYLPFVSSCDSCLQTEHRRTGEGDTILWEDGDGVYSFDDIYSKKHITNYFHHLPSHAAMPHPYLRADDEGYLRPGMGEYVRPGTYYVNRWRPLRRESDQKSYAPYGFFIEIQEAGWRIAGYDMCEGFIVSMDQGDSVKRINPVRHVSPLLEFNKEYKLQRVAPCPQEITLSIRRAS